MRKANKSWYFPPKSNLQEELWKSGRLAELGAVTVTKGLTTEKVETTKIYGPKPIADVAYAIGTEMSKAIAQIRKKHLGK